MLLHHTLGRDGLSPQRRRQEPAMATHGTPDSSQHSRASERLEQRGDEQRGSGDLEVIEVEGPQPTPPTQHTPPEGRAATPPLIDVAALLANPGADLVLQSRTSRHRFGLGSGAGGGRGRGWVDRGSRGNIHSHPGRLPTTRDGRGRRG